MRVTIPSDGPSLLEGYRAIVGDEPIRMLERLAVALRGRRVVMVNSTAGGGGVAEILHRLVRLMVELGVPTVWEVMPGDQRFYGITKMLHNALHGHAPSPGPEDWDHFAAVNRRAAETLELDGDLVMIHDPQPIGLVGLRRRNGQRWVWRCHIDLSTADPDAWAVLAPHVARYDAAVYSHHDFVASPSIPSYLAPPSIDPLADKNRPLAEEEMDALLDPFQLPTRRPWVTQVSRFDRLKDPLGVVEAFRMVRRQEAAHLVLAGGSADDDPEGAAVLAEVQAACAGRDDVSILALPPDAHRVINALQRRSTVVLQKSLREGFALTVSEALWKRRAVIGGAVGGIPLQILHERTGMLVRSVQGCAYQVTRLLRAPGLRQRLGRAGYVHVREHFLHPRELRDYLAIFARLAGPGAAV